MIDAIVAVLGIAFSAFVVWLTVRIVNRHERWAKRTAWGIVGALVLYSMSFWPACWLVTRRVLPLMATAEIYRPVILGLARGPESLRFSVTLDDPDTQLTLMLMTNAAKY